jgi:hypothetical protein
MGRISSRLFCVTGVSEPGRHYGRIAWLGLPKSAVLKS